MSDHERLIAPAAPAVLPTMVALTAGAFAGFVSDGMVHPVDTLRARLQVQRGNAEYSGVVDAFRKTVSREGWKGLYRGFGIVASFTVPAHALYFFGYEVSKKILSPKSDITKSGPVVHFASGFIADLFGSLIWTPMDVVKQRLQVQKASSSSSSAFASSSPSLPPSTPHLRGSFHALTYIAKVEGLPALYKGFFPALATYGPFVGVYFVCYEQLKKSFNIYSGKPQDADVPLLAQLISGALSGGIAAGITSPLDIVKTRLQVESKFTQNAYKNAFDAFARIAREEGMGAFVQGLSARVLWMAPSCALTIATYEQCKRLYWNSKKNHS